MRPTSCKRCTTSLAHATYPCPSPPARRPAAPPLRFIARARRRGKRTSAVEACGLQLAQYLTPMHQLVMLLGAAVHDLGHTGRFGRL